MSSIDATLALQPSHKIDSTNQLQLGPIRWDMLVTESKQAEWRPQSISGMDQLRFSASVSIDQPALANTIQPQGLMISSHHRGSPVAVSNVAGLFMICSLYVGLPPIIW